MRIENALDPIDLKIKPPLGHIKYLPLPIPQNIDGYNLETLKGEKLAFKSHQELKNWKYQTYIKDYLRCIASIDESVGNLLQYLEQEHLINDTIIVYSSDQGFFLGDYGWYDKKLCMRNLSHAALIRIPKKKQGYYQ
jgi:arylsulfatase A-like enzyme